MKKHHHSTPTPEPALQAYKVRGALIEDTNSTLSDMVMATNEEDVVRQFNAKHPGYRVINIMSMQEAQQTAQRLKEFQDRAKRK